MVVQKNPLDETIDALIEQMLIYCVVWYLPMFCPECGTLSFPTPSGDINCTNYKCGYQGPANVKVRGADGKEVDLSKASSSTKAETRVYEVIKDSDEMKGVLTVGDYMLSLIHI